MERWEAVRRDDKSWGKGAEPLRLLHPRLCFQPELFLLRGWLQWVVDRSSGRLNSGEVAQ